MKTKPVFRFLLLLVCLLFYNNLQAITIHVETAGTLPSLIPESEKYEITELTLTGNLNNVDIRFIREMAGRDYLGNSTNGKLTILDFADANIVDYNKPADANSAYYRSGLGDRYSPYIYHATNNNTISRYMFINCDRLTSIMMPKNVTLIDWYAFSGCAALINAPIPAGVTSIGIYAFSECSELTNVILPDGITLIQRCVFWGCTRLTEINIPDKVSFIEDEAFAYCTSLKAFNVSGQNTAYCDVDGVLFDQTKTVLYRYPNAKASSYIVPDGVASIKKYAFYTCIGLSNVILPNSLQSIGQYAFYQCTGLTTITMNGVTSIEQGAFQNCTGLTTVTMNNVREIGQSAFEHCISLIDITLPNSLTSIESSTFMGCTGLTDVTLPNSLTSIESNAFTGCSGLIDITLPSSLSLIQYCAFSKCTRLKEITIPSNVTYIENRAFADCTSLKAFHVSDQNTQYCDVDGVLFDKAKTGLHSYPNAKASSYIIPDGVISIFNYAFENCIGLNNIILPNSLQTIGYYAFTDCINLTEITIPKSVITMKLGFHNCIGLISATINSVSVGESAFYQCTGLINIILSNNLTSIENSAFADCNNVAEIHSNNTIPPKVISYHSFGDNIWMSCKVYVPTGSKEAYQRAEQWMYFFNIIEEELTALPIHNIQNIIIQSVANGISIETQEITPIAIYTIVGQKVYQADINGQVNIALDQGIYIVKTENNNRKVSVK